MGGVTQFLDIDPVAGTVTFDAGVAAGPAEVPLARLGVRYYGEVVVWVDVEGPELRVGWAPFRRSESASGA